MKGFKNTGRGPKSGHSFSSKAGFSGSTGRTQNVRGYTRGVPGKKAFASGGVVRVADPGSSLTRRNQPVTEFDAQHGGKSPLRSGFAEGGKVGGAKKAVNLTRAYINKNMRKVGDREDSGTMKFLAEHRSDTKKARNRTLAQQGMTTEEAKKAGFAEGGKVATTGAAIKMMKELMRQGNSAGDAAAKAARRYGVSPSGLKPASGPTGGGGIPAEKQMLARGGRPMGGRAVPVATRIAAPPPVAPAVGRAGPSTLGQSAHHGRSFGSFGRTPIVR